MCQGMKRLFHLLLLCAAIYSWVLFNQQGPKIDRLEAELEELHNQGAEEDALLKKEDEWNNAKSLRIANGLLLTFLTSGVVGILVVSYLIPLFAQRMTQVAYGSDEELGRDAMREAHSLLAQGEYEAAIESFRQVAAEDPSNRLPWVEIAKIQYAHLNNPALSIKTLQGALEGQEWPIDDAAFFMFRLAEIYDEAFGDRHTARSIIQQVIDNFPQTRHSANATHKLREWDTQDQEAARHAEEQQFFAGRRDDDV